MTPDSNGNVTVKVQSIASNSDVISGTDNTKMMTPLRTKESVQQFSPTDYVTGLSVSGQTVTFNKKDGTSGSIITQDTKYTHPNSGVKVGTYNSVTVNAQGHVTGGSNVDYNNFPSGTQLLFYQANAPTGWTKVTGIGDSTIKIVEDGSGGTLAGSVAFSGVFKTLNTNSVSTSGTVGATKLSVSQLASHNHTIGDSDTAAGNGLSTFDGGSINPSYQRPTSSTGSNATHTHSFSGSSHSHTVNLSVKYINVIVCRKD